jgi:hypothetical protein
MEASMKTTAVMIAGALLSLSGVGVASAQAQSGQLAAGPPTDIEMKITLDADGTASLSESEFHLTWGGYYRFNLVCPASGLKNETAIGFFAPALWENSHLRIASVGDTSQGLEGGGEINFHIQGLQIRELECEGLPQTARFSFYPIKKGTYPFTLKNDATTPPQELEGSFVVE